MTEHLPNCPLCAEGMNLEGGPSPRAAWCDNDDCVLYLVALPLAALARLAALRPALTEDQADALLDAFDDECPAGTPHNTAAARMHIRDALIGKR